MIYGKSKGEKIKVDGMLAATFFVTIFYSATYPFIHKQIISTAPSSIIALSQIINCLSVVTFGFIWNRNSDAPRREGKNPFAECSASSADKQNQGTRFILRGPVRTADYLRRKLRPKAVQPDHDLR